MNRVSRQVAFGLLVSGMIVSFQNCSKTAFSPTSDGDVAFLGNSSDSEQVTEDPINNDSEDFPIIPSPEFTSGPCLALEEVVEPSSQAPDSIFEKLIGNKINSIESANIVNIGSFAGDLLIKSAMNVSIAKISTNRLIVNAINIENIGVSGHSCLNAVEINKVQSRAHAKLRAQKIHSVDFRGHLHIYGAVVDKITGAGHVCLYDNAKVSSYEGSIHFKNCDRSMN